LEFTTSIDPKDVWVVLGLYSLLLVLVAIGVLWFVSQWRKAGELADGDIFAEMGYDELADEEFFVESRPWRFRYSDARPHPTRAGRRHTFLLPRAPVTATPSSSPALRSPPHLPRPLRLAAARNGVGWGTRRPWWRRLDPDSP
jgi:hypothetical protein